MFARLFALFARPTPPYTRGPHGSPHPGLPEAIPPRNIPLLSAGASPLINGVLGSSLALIILVLVLVASSRPEVGVGGAIVFAILGVAILGIFLYVLGDRIVKSLIKQASEILFAPFGIHDENSAFALLYQYLISNQAPILIVTQGGIDPRCSDSPLTKMGNRGPGFVQVDDVSAVLVENTTKEAATNVSAGFQVTTKVMRILTLGQHFLGAHDTIRGYVDLKLHEEQLSMKNVVTKDGISLDFGLQLYYRIAQNQGNLLRSGQYLASRDAVKLAILASSDWKFQTKVTSESTIRDYFARFVFNDIQGIYPSASQVKLNDNDNPPQQTNSENAPRATIQLELMQEINNAIARWGSEIVTIGIDQIQVPSEVRSTLHRAWTAAWENKIAIDRANTDAEVEKLDATGKLGAAEIKRQIELIAAQIEAERQLIIERARAEIEKSVAEVEQARNVAAFEVEQARFSAEVERERIKELARSEARVELLRRLDHLQRSTGRIIDEKWVRELLRSLVPSKQSARLDQEKSDEKE